MAEVSTSYGKVPMSPELAIVTEHFNAQLKRLGAIVDELETRQAATAGQVIRHGAQLDEMRIRLEMDLDG